MMGTNVFVGNSPSSATGDELWRPRATHGEAASLSMVEAESPVRYRGLGGSNTPALVELEPMVSEPQRAMKKSPAASPVWENGTLPGIMAGKRPQSGSTSQSWGKFVVRRRA